MSTAIWHKPEDNVNILFGLITHYEQLTECYLDNARFFDGRNQPELASAYREMAEHEMHREAIARNKLVDMGININA